MKPAGLKSSSWSFSIAVHAIVLLLLGFLWIVDLPEEEFCPGFTRWRPAEEPPVFPERKAQDHSPIVPKDYQPDPEIINDASEVVVNTVPTEIDGAVTSGDSLHALSDESFKGRLVSGAIGLEGSPGRRGAYASRFG